MLSSCYGESDESTDEDTDAIETSEEEHGQKVVTFQPGPVGIGADWATGLITNVVPGEQADHLGVKEDWVVLRVNEERYSHELLRTKVAAREPYVIRFRTRCPGRGLMRYSKVRNANNVWTISIPEEIVDEAARIYTDEILPEYMLLRPTVESMPDRKCFPFKTASGSSFCLTQSSSKISMSDLVWISVDDEATYRQFEHLFHRSGVVEFFLPLIDHDKTLRLFAIEFMARSMVSEPKFHCDNWPCVGTDCLTFILPITPYPEGCHGLNLLYKNLDGESHTYVYRHSEAIIFGSGFEHSTEPGESKTPLAFLVFTFGTDCQDMWPYIARTVGLTRRFVCNASGQFEQTTTSHMHEIDEALRAFASSNFGNSTCTLL